LLSRIGAFVASTDLPPMVTGTLTFRDWYVAFTGSAQYVMAL
jgi:hypothetical protein